MNLMTRILVGIVLALAALCGVQYVLYVGLQHRLAAAQADLKVAQYDAAATKAALAAKTSAVAKAEARAAATRKELDRALKANPEWAAAPVPDDVWRGLYPDAGAAAAAR
ncbi:Rz-like spanin [Ralstonia phage RS-PII-1]|uniref:I-spanin n=1 Tax=Ralstonia phage RS-PII-1 TaxID=1932892 RepID=A0A1L7DQ98_9CAUD|nr:Rz-like spanin [Ralstonia phage RS-PII-1]APU00291.1 hypothetical protein [Ralstonia phage RS-PII-1]